MGILKDTKDALKTALVAAAPAGSVVLVGVEPEAVDVTAWPKWFIIVLDSNPYEENITIGTVTQWMSFNWSIYVYAGHAGRDEDAIDVLDPMVTAVLGLANTQLDSNSKPLEIREGCEFYTWLGDSPVYRMQLYHERKP